MERLKVEEIQVPASEVSVYEALYRRRNTWLFQDRDVPAEKVERLLGAAVWAPNHKMTEPWRFFVLGRHSQARGEAAELTYAHMLQSSGEAKARQSQAKVLEPPVLVYAFSVPGEDEHRTRENYAAVVCAMFSICLAAVAEGLGVGWESGGMTRAPGLSELLGAPPEWSVVAMMAIGFPKDDRSASRATASSFVRWLD